METTVCNMTTQGTVIVGQRPNLKPSLHSWRDFFKIHVKWFLLQCKMCSYTRKVTLAGAFSDPSNEPPLMTKPTKWHMHTTKTQNQPGHLSSLIRVFAVHMKKLGSLATHWAHRKDSGQTGRMPDALIWVFAGCTVILLVLSGGGSNAHAQVCHFVWSFLTFLILREWSEGTGETELMHKLTWAFAFCLCEGIVICEAICQIFYQSTVHIHVCCFCCLFGFNIAFNNFSVKSRRCLVVRGSSVLTFIVLPQWKIKPQTLDMIPHPVTLSWFLTLGRPVLALPVSLSDKWGAACTIFNDWYVAAQDWTHDLRFSEADTTYWATWASLIHVCR